MTYIEAPNPHGKFSFGSIFLAGGITDCPDWQSEVAAGLQDTDAMVYNPRRANFPMGDPFAGGQQIEWEHKALMGCFTILFWFPEETLCPIVLFELGAQSQLHKRLVVGTHPNYKRRFDVQHQLRLARPEVHVWDSLDDVIAEAKGCCDVSL